MTAAMSREQILALPPTMTLATLARCLDRSEPTIRQLHRSGELARLGIRVNRLGQRYSVITSSVWAYLGFIRPRPAEAGAAQQQAQVLA